MKITPIKYNAQTFSGYYQVKVPKDSFDNPDIYTKCEDDFSEIVSFGIELRKNKNSSNSFFDKLNQEPVSKMFFSYLESPIYSTLKDNYRYGENWISNHTGIKINEPHNTDYHTFTILTKQQKDNMFKLMGKNNLRNMKKTINQEMKQRNKAGLPIDGVWQTAKAYEIFQGFAAKATNNKQPDKVITLDNLEEISKVIDEIDV